MNIYNKHRALAIIIDILITLLGHLISMYFSTKAGKNTEHKNIIFYESTKKLEEQVK